MSPVRPDAYGVGLARRAWMWAASLAAEYRLLTIVIATYEAAAEGSHLLPGDHVVLPARQAATPADWVAADRELIARLRAALPTEVPVRLVMLRLYLLDLLPHLPAAWQPLCELDCDDQESQTRYSMAGIAWRRGHPGQALRHLSAAFAYRNAEGRALRQVAKIHVAAEEDAVILRRRDPIASVQVTPNRIAGPFPLLQSAPRPLRVLFVGTLNYLPNRDAALWLADVIAPHLRRLVPAVEVAVAGAAPVELIRRLQRAGVNYIEAVPGFAKAYAGSAAVIAPLRGGGGTKFKVLEAWLHGCPVVATTHACRGLGVHPGKHLLQADGPEELAVACAALFTNPALATKIAQAGRAFLTDRFLVPHPDV